MKTNLFNFRLLILIVIILNSCSQKNDNDQTDVPTKVVIDEAKPLGTHKERMKTIWRKEMYETALELNKELAKQNKPLMNEELLNLYADCMYDEMEKKYPDIDDIANKKAAHDKEFYKNFTAIVKSCGEDVVLSRSINKP